MSLLDIPGLMAYSRPDMLGLSDGDTVTVDTDFSVGGTYNGTPIGSPIYNAARKAIHLDGATQYLTYDGVLGVGNIAIDVFHGTNSPFSWIGLVQLETIPPGVDHGNYFIAANISGGLNNPTKDFYCAAETGELLHSDSRNDDASLEYLDGSATPNTLMHVMGYGFDGTYSYKWLNGLCVSKQKGNVGAVTLNVNGGFTEGCHRRNGVLGAFLPGWRGPRGIWGRCLANTEWQTATADLQALVASAPPPPFEPSQFLLPLTSWTPLTLDGSGSWTDGNPVTAWSPRGYQNYNMTINDVQGGSNPTYAVNQQGGLPMVRFGAGIVMWPNLNKAGSQFTRAGVPAFSFSAAVKCAGIGAEQDLFTVYASNPPNGKAYIRVGINAAGAWQAKQRNDAGTVTTVTGGTADTKFHLLQFTFDGALANMWDNGTQILNNAALSGGASVIDWCSPDGGNYIDSVQSREWQGLIGQSSMFTNDALTSSQAAQVLAYDRIVWDFPVPTPPVMAKGVATEYGAGVETGILAGEGKVLLGPWQTTDREQMRIQFNVRGTLAFNLNYEFSTDQGTTWYVGEQVAAASVSVDDGVNYPKQAHGHFDVGYWWRISVFNTDVSTPLDIAFEWRFHMF